MYDDGGLSGGTIERPALQRLLSDIKSSKVQIIVVYKVDRLTRSLADFAKIVDVLDADDASFVSVTQQFNTTTSMGRLTLNMVLSFAQFEREIAGAWSAASATGTSWPIPRGGDLSAFPRSARCRADDRRLLRVCRSRLRSRCARRPTQRRAR
jgi:Resolvase, N terminal domain